MKRLPLGLLLGMMIVSGMAYAATTELITDGNNDIPVKNTGDAFSATEFNSILDLLRGWSRDDNNTFNDQTDDKVGINGVSSPSEALEVNGRVKATSFLGDGSLLTGIDAGYWVQTGSNVNYPTGNVGIGVANPGEKLEVAGNVKLTGTTPSVFFNDAETTAVQWNNSTKTQFLSNGNVIGSFTRIGNSSGSLQMKQFSAGTTADGSPAFAFVDDTDSGLYLHGDGKVGISAGGVGSLIVEDSGNVGIGTSSPDSDLHIEGETAVALRLSNTNGAGDFETIISQNYNAGKCLEITNRGDRVFSYACSTDRLALFTSDTERLVIDNTGNVGIGTPSPSNNLEVVGSGATTSALIKGPGTTGQANLIVNSGGTSGFQTVVNTSGAYLVQSSGTSGLNVRARGGDFTIATGAGDTERFRVLSSNGNVGIGDPTPTSKLDVQGNLRVGSGYNNIAAPVNGAIIEGNVGVGNSAPTYKLDVAGDVNFTGNLRQNGVLFDPGGKFIDGTDTDDAVYTAGNVGIGIADPARQLHVGGTGHISVGPTNTVASDSTAGLYWYNSSAYSIARTPGAWTAPGYQQLRLDWPTGIVLDPGTGNNAGYDKSYVDITGGKGLRVSQGNLGIGIAGPLNKLHVSASDPNIRITDTDTGANTLLLTNSGVGGAVLAADYGDAVAGSYLGFSVDGGAEKVRIKADGNVGIGTTNPSVKLSIEGAGANYAAGPHTEYRVAGNTHPVFQQLNWGTDNVTLSFDSYYNGAWRSSDAGSNFQIRKNADQLQFNSDAGNTHFSYLDSRSNQLWRGIYDH